MSSNAKSFLNKLKDLNDSNTVTVKVPSTGKDVEFKLASVKQQKDLIRTTFDGLDGVIGRASVINKIITDNAVSEEEFLTIDVPGVMIALRNASIGSEIKVKDKKYNLNNVTPVKKSDVKLNHSVEHDNIKVDLKVPTLAVDSQIAEKLSKEFAKFDTIDDKLRQSIDTVISFESAKYIETVTVGEDAITFADISVHERVDIINHLPLTLNNKIVEYIASIKEVVDKALTVAEEVVVEIDAGFLSGD